MLITQPLNHVLQICILNLRRRPLHIDLVKIHQFDGGEYIEGRREFKISRPDPFFYDIELG